MYGLFHLRQQGPKPFLHGVGVPMPQMAPVGHQAGAHRFPFQLARFIPFPKDFRFYLVSGYAV